MSLSHKMVDWHMCRISNITYALPPKKNICNRVIKCEGEILLRKWKQGNTSLSRTIKRPLILGVFFFVYSVYVIVCFYNIGIGNCIRLVQGCSL